MYEPTGGDNDNTNAHQHSGMMILHERTRREGRAGERPAAVVVGCERWLLFGRACVGACVGACVRTCVRVCLFVLARGCHANPFILDASLHLLLIRMYVCSYHMYDTCHIPFGVLYVSYVSSRTSQSWLVGEKHGKDDGQVPNTAGAVFSFSVQFFLFLKDVRQ